MNTIISSGFRERTRWVPEKMLFNRPQLPFTFKTFVRLKILRHQQYKASKRLRFALCHGGGEMRIRLVPLPFDCRDIRALVPPSVEAFRA